jgi:glycosyltransferase
MFISIITSTYNSEEFLSAALKSYQFQDYSKKELVVVDGGSVDGTLDIINQHQSEIGSWVSESDAGIYDALNKGLQMCNGEVIGVLHSDDILASTEVLKKVAEAFKENPDADAVFGDLQYIKRDQENEVIRNWISGKSSQRKFKLGWMPPHPALFIKKSCFLKHGNYDLSYRSAADYDLILRFFYKFQLKAVYLPEVLVKMREGGISNLSLKNRLRANKEDRAIMKRNGIAFSTVVAALKPLRKIGQFIKIVYS